MHERILLRIDMPVSSKLALPTRTPYAIKGGWGGLVPDHPREEKNVEKTGQMAVFELLRKVAKNGAKKVEKT